MINLDGGNSTNSSIKKSQQHVDNNIFIHLMISFRQICIITLLLPLGAMFVCFVTAYVFQPEEIHETHCRVYNIIPSISAITGVSPQRYLWRISIALHIGPRFVVAFVYRSYYRNILSTSLANTQQLQRILRLINFVHWLSMIEISALLGVTYISNRENYPLHEKVFIVFMTASLTYMMYTIKLVKLLQPSGPPTPNDELSLQLKKLFFGIAISATIGLILFFLKHRFLCHDMAFSWFAFCEYVVASANMGFHCTTMLDFPTEYFMIVKNAVHLKNKLIQTSSNDWKLD